MEREPITNTELAILGLIAETARHGYQIEQQIAARGMREWTEIGFSSIYYVLNKLEGAGWLASTLEEEHSRGKGPARRVYHLTGAGGAALAQAVRERLEHPRPHSGDFSLALANLPALPPTEVRAALETFRAGLVQRLEDVRAKWQADRAAAGRYFPPHVDALFGHSVALMEAELAWVEQFLAGSGAAFRGKSIEHNTETRTP